MRLLAKLAGALDASSLCRFRISAESAEEFAEEIAEESADACGAARLATVVPRLWPFTAHPSPDARTAAISVLVSLIEATSADNDLDIWLPPIAADALTVLYQAQTGHLHGEGLYS